MTGTAIGLAAAVIAAALFGVAAVLQAHAVRTDEHPIESLAGFVGAAIHNRYLLMVIAAYLVGFVLHAVSIWYLPLYLAQAAVSLSLPITALGAARLRERLGTAEWLAVAGIVAGLVLVSVGSGEPGDSRSSVSFALLLWTGVGVLGIVGIFSSRVGAGVLGAVAGLGYAGSAIAVRGVTTPLDLCVAAAALAVPAYGLLAFWIYSLALNRAAVAGASAPLVVGQTLVPALVGTWALGDSVRDGWVVVVALGMMLAVGGAVGLSRSTAGPVSSSGAGSAR